MNLGYRLWDKLVFGLCAFIFIPAPLHLDNVKLFAISFFGLCATSFYTIKKKNISLSFFECFIGVFLICNILLIGRANNVSLSLYPIFALFNILLLLMILKSMDREKIVRGLRKLSIMVLSVIVFYSILFFVDDGNFLSRFSKYFSSGPNYICAYGMMLIPFGLVVLRPFNIPMLFLNFLMIISIVYLIIVGQVRGAAIGIIVQIVFLFGFLLTRKYQFRLKIVAPAMALIIVLVVLAYLNLNPESFKRFEFSRIYNQILAFNIFKENVPFGVGLGNWYYGLYQQDLSHFGYFYLYYNKLMFVSSHNYFGELLAETGVLSILYFLPFLIIIWNKRKIILKDDPLLQASFISIIIYLLLSCIYKSANSRALLLSNIQLLAFMSAFIIVGSKKSFSLNYYWNIAIGIISILSMIYFYCFNTNNSIIKSINRSCNIERVNALKDIYNPVALYHTNKNSIHGLLANCYQELNDPINYINHLNVAIIENPRHPDLQLDLAFFYLRKDKDLTKALTYVDRLLQHHQAYNEARILKVEILSLNGNFNQAKIILSEIEKSRFYKPYKPFVMYWYSFIDFHENPRFLKIDEADIISNKLKEIGDFMLTIERNNRERVVNYQLLKRVEKLNRQMNLAGTK